MTHLKVKLPYSNFLIFLFYIEKITKRETFHFVLLDIYNVPFTFFPITAAVSIRKPAFAVIYFGHCRLKWHIKGDIMYCVTKLKGTYFGGAREKPAKMWFAYKLYLLCGWALQKDGWD